MKIDFVPFFLYPKRVFLSNIIRIEYLRMADSPEKKKFTERLRDIFRRKAKVVVPPEIANNRDVQKAALKARRGRRWKAFRNIAIASTALSTVLQFYPDTVSKPFNEYMGQQGYSENLHDHFHAPNIRVYSRTNPLYPFHLAGHTTVLTWDEAARQGDGVVSRALSAPLVYGVSLFSGISGMIFSDPLDAYAISNNDPIEGRTVFIRPPKEVTVERFLESFSGLNTAELKFKHPSEDLQRVLFQYVMLHEARHGDQDKGVVTALLEADADRYAFDVLAARGTPAALLAEARTIITHGRTLASTLGGGTSHATSISLTRTSYQTPYDAYADGQAFSRLHKLLSDADDMNKDAFPEDMVAGNRYFYLAAAMRLNGVLDKDPELRNANNMFMASVVYFDQASGHNLINPFFDLNTVNVTYLKEAYKPVEDKLTPPAAASKRPAPRPGS